MLKRIAKYSVKNILRNKFLSISSVLVLTLLMFFINILIILHDVSFKLIDIVNSKMTISLYLEDWYDKATIEVSDLITDIQILDETIWVEYRTKEDNLDKIMEREPKLVKILERTNPLPETIVLSNIWLDKYEELNNIIEWKMFLLSKEEDDIKHFSNYSTQYDKINWVINVLSVLQYGLYLIIAIFVISISIIIYSVIWNFIYYFKDEIYITRLVWGGRSFIYGPFVLQWSIYSFVAFIFSFIWFIFILNYINNTFSDLYTFQFSSEIFILEMILFVFIGAFAWLLSSKKYLK